MSGPTIRFLTLEFVLDLHEIAIADQGGDSSIRDRGLLDAALAMPRQQFNGEYLHATIPAMAAAYAFHIAKNHPFVDGNKRAAFASMVAFLVENGWRLHAEPTDAETTILQLAAGAIDKDTLTAWATKHCRELPRIELRNFFASIEPNDFLQRYLALLPAVTGSSPAELRLSAQEASQAIPLIAKLAQEQQSAKLRDDTNAWTQATAIALAFTVLYRIAEDQGYEW